MTDDIYRLEQALHCWEDQCFVLALGARASRAQRRQTWPLSGPLVHAGSFRRALLEARDGVAFDVERYLGPAAVRQAMLSWGVFPSSLWSWTRDSRRVYRLNAELQDLIERTSLAGLTWEDIPWPFESFAISLPTPIIFSMPLGIGGGEARFDYILVTRGAVPLGGRVEPLMHALLLGERLATRRPLTENQKRRMNSWLLRNNFSPLRRELQAQIADMRIPLTCVLLPVPTSRSALIGEDLPSMFQMQQELQEQIQGAFPENSPFGQLLGGTGSIEHVIRAQRIIAGLMIYVTNAPPKSPHLSNWHPPAIPTTDPLCIFHESQVCDVIGVYEQTDDDPEEGSPLDGSRREPRPHDRQGYYRRRPGSGNDPNAPKILWVRPTRVNDERRAPGTLPVGTTRNV